ncbi:hypothetical protein [Bifidobacterium pseudolongum]|uniref:hypothetical protein n=1 Tax=Bifidobacterium pseudolongum TaxID=1694 RepID=UPI0010210B2C|nr:hypothetical protein [Bifidobacterium pseudolongum]
MGIPVHVGIPTVRICGIIEKEALDARRIARKQGYLHKGDMRDDIAHILRVKPTAMVVLRLQPPR